MKQSKWPISDLKPERKETTNRIMMDPTTDIDRQVPVTWTD